MLDVVLVTSCADREIALMYTFVVKSVCHIMRHTLQETSSLTTSIFRQTILLRRMTFIFLDSSWKRIHAWVRKIERISPISSISTSLSYFFEFDRKESRLDETFWRRRFVVLERILSQFFKKSDSVFSSSFFFWWIPGREMIVRLLCVLRLLSLCICRRLHRKNNHSNSTRLG